MAIRKKHRFAKFLLYLSLISVVALVVLALLQWQNNLVTDLVIDYLNKKMQEEGEITYDRIEGSLFFSIKIQNARFHTAEGPDIRAKYIKAGYNPLSFVFGPMQVSRLYIEKLQVAFPQTGEKETTESANADSVLSWLEKTNFSALILAVMPGLTLNNLEIVLGEVSVAGKGITWKDINLRISHLKVSAKDYYLRLNRLSGYWVEPDLHVRRLSFTLKGDRQRLALNDFELLTEHSGISLSLLFDTAPQKPDISLQIYSLDINLDELSPITKENELRAGFLKGKAQLDGSPQHFALQLDARAKTLHYQLDTLRLNLEYNRGLFTLHRLQGRSNAGEIDAAFVIDRQKSARGELSFRYVNLNKIFDYPLTTSLNGAVNFKLRNLDLNRLNGHGNLRLYHSVLDSVLLDSLQLNLTADRGEYTIEDNSFLRLSKNSRFIVNGRISRERQLDVLLASFDNNLGEAAARFGLDSLSGIFDGHVRAMGNLKNPDISANLEIPYIAYKDIKMDSVGLTIYMGQIFTGRRGEAHFHIARGAIGDFPLSSARIDTRFDSTMLVVDDIHFYSEENFLQGTLQVDFDREKTVVKAPSFEAKYHNYWLRNEDSLIIVVDQNGVTIENFVLVGPQDSGIEVSGFWDNQQEDMQLALSFDGVRIGPFQQFIGENFRMKGRVDGVAELITPLHESNLDIDVVIDSLVYDDVPLGKVTSVFQYAHNTFYINRLDLKYDNMSIESGGDIAFSLDKEGDISFSSFQRSKLNFKLNYKNVNLRHFNKLIHPAERLRGVLNGYLEAKGQLAHPLIRTGLRADNFIYGGYELDSLVFFGQYNDGYIILDSLSTQLNGTALSLKGWQQYELNLSQIDTTFAEKRFQLWITSHDRQMKFLSRLTDQVENIKGDYAMDFHLGGTLRHPALLDGFLRLQNGRLILSKVKDPLKNVTIDAVVRDSVLIFKKASAMSLPAEDFWEKGWSYFEDLLPWTSTDNEKGLLNIAGEISFKDILRPRYDLRLALNDFYIDYFVENTELILNSKNLSVKGRDTIQISGEVYIPRGSYQVDVKQIQRDAEIETAQTLPKPPYLSMNLTIKLPGNFSIVSSPTDFLNNFDIAIEGELHILKEPLNPDYRIAGYLDTQSGYYQAWNQRFIIESGSIRLVDPTRFNPNINLTLNKRVGEQLFVLNIFGPLDKLEQNMTVYENGKEISMSEADKLTLLTFGVNTKELQQNTQSSLRTIGADVLANSVLNVLERKAEQATGLDRVKIDRDGSQEDIHKGQLNSGLQDASISFGKYLTSDLYVEYRTRFNNDIPAPKLGWEAGNRIQLEYRVNRNWRLNSYYEKTIEGNNKFQVGIDWEYTF